MTRDDIVKIETTLSYLKIAREMLPDIYGDLTHAIKSIEEELVKCYLESED